MHKLIPVYKQKQSATFLNGPYMLVDFDVREQQEMDFFTGGSFIMDYGLIIYLETTVCI